MNKKLRIALTIFMSAPPLLSAANIDFGGELRLRPELRTNPDFNKDTHESNSLVGSRLRISGTGQAAENVSVKFTFQDSRIWGEEPGTAAGFTDTGEAVDLHEGYVDFSNVFVSQLKLRAGRQELAFGDQRLIGPLGWSNQGRSFDAFRLTWDHPVATVDAFTAKRKESNGTAAANGDLDRDLSGLYATLKKITPYSTVDLYVLNDREGDSASPAPSKNITTIGARWALKAAGWDATLEAPFQFGDNGTVVNASSDAVKIKASAFAGKTGYMFPGEKEIRLGVEYDFASGDDNSGDTTSHTFQNLYPTNHPYYGLMDNQSWRNMNAINVNAAAKPTKATSLLLSFWTFALDEEKDGWYNAAGSSAGTLRSASPNNTDTAVGQEIDLLLKWNQSASVLWEAGYGHFFAGDFIKNRVANEGDSDWAYVMSTVRF